MIGRIKHRQRKGTQFGRLTVVLDKSAQDVVCRCVCGNEKTYRRGSLRRGDTKSCGCLQREVTAERVRNLGTPIEPGTQFVRLTVIEDGGSQDVVCRCVCGNEKTYRRSSLRNGDAKSCRCLSRELTAERNRERKLPRYNNVMITAFGETQCLADWSRESGIKPATIRKRMKDGWDHEDAVCFLPYSRVRRR